MNISAIVHIRKMYRNHTECEIKLRMSAPSVPEKEGEQRYFYKASAVEAGVNCETMCPKCIESKASFVPYDLIVFGEDVANAILEHAHAKAEEAKARFLQTFYE